MRQARDVELPLALDRTSGIPLTTQIAAGVRDALIAGVLLPGDALPSSRTIATRLGVSRGSVVAAFDQLHGEGWLVADRGATRVDPALARHLLDPPPSPTSMRGPARTPAGEVAPIDLRPGRPDTSRVADPAWRSAWREAVARPWSSHPATGSSHLREALTEHLRLSRALVVPPEEVIVTGGVREGLHLLLTAMRRDLGRPVRVAVEDPGFPALRRLVAALGDILVPVSTDEEGLRPDHLADLDPAPDLVLLTPGHQYPLGGAMPIARRLDLIAWAGANRALLLEDDYDGELRYTGEPLPALAALDRQVEPGGGRVALLGSFAKVLAPGLGVGHLIVPASIHSGLAALRTDLGSPVPALVQDAVASYLDAGALRRHTARMRRVYRQRRDVAERVLRDLPGVTLRPMAGGLHAVIDVATDANGERGLLAAAAAAGVEVAGLADYWAAGTPRMHGIVVGLGAADLEEGLRVLLPLLTDAADAATGQRRWSTTKPPSSRTT